LSTSGGSRIGVIRCYGSSTMFRRPTIVIALLLTGCLLIYTACARRGRGPAEAADNRPGNFDYYLLTLSWAPEFCATHAGNASSSECDPQRHFGFVVHGLWPENDDGSHPQNCAPTQPVAQPTVQQMLAIMPARGLIQHEWVTHGTCSGLRAQDYFAAIEKAFRQVEIPPEYRAPGQAFEATPAEIEQKFAAANRVPVGDFRVSCSGTELVGVEVCLTKDLQYRQCGSRLRDCRAPQVTVEPTP
jgi:ribonuclease T2